MTSAGYETILVQKSGGLVTVTMNRTAQRNSINRVLLEELNEILDEIENDPRCRMIILEGQNGWFSTGIDFGDVQAAQSANTQDWQLMLSEYIRTLKRFALIPKVIAAKVDGQAIAGGVGLAAASDLVFATPRSQFSLSEALWGLLPAMVLPFLIRRVGFQTAYRMTLTTLPVSAPEGQAVHLVDEVSDVPDESIHRVWQRIARLNGSIIGDMKRYFRKMWLINEEMEETALLEISRLMTEPRVRGYIENYIKYKKFPWEGPPGKST